MAEALSPDIIAARACEAFALLCGDARVPQGALIVVGCSTSEIAGGRIGKLPQPGLGDAIAQALLREAQARGVAVAFQCCEHLNRALVLPRAEAVRRGLRIVTAVPYASAGGACAAAAFRAMADPVLVETIEADAGMDIGDTLIGMHLKRVAVPLRAPFSRIGEANLVMAVTRPPYIGGPRARYERDEA